MGRSSEVFTRPHLLALAKHWFTAAAGPPSDMVTRSHRTLSLMYAKHSTPGLVELPCEILSTQYSDHDARPQGLCDCFLVKHWACDPGPL